VTKELPEADIQVYSAEEVTLHRWIEKRVVPEPATQRIAGSQIRNWTDEGFAKLKQYKAEQYQEKPRRKPGKGRKGS